MIKCYTLIAFSLLTFVAAFAQKPKVNIEKMHDKSLHFYMSKESNMPYTAFISFYELYNVKNKPVKNTVQKFVVDDSNTPFLRLYPENPQRQAGASYRVSIMRGDLNKVADVDYVYMAPVSQDREIEFDIKGDVSKQLYPLTGKDLYEIRLNTEYGDTIYATRAGYAYNIKTQTEEQFADKPIKNAIYLYHADGASTKYMIASIFKPFVSKEQYVRAGDPIGVIVKPENINAELTFKPSAKLSLKFDAFFDMKNIDAETLKLLDEEMLNNTEFGALKDLYDKMKEDGDRFNTYLDRLDGKRKCNFIPRFYVAEGFMERIVSDTTLKIEHPLLLITNEMNKKEKKAYLKHTEKK